MQTTEQQKTEYSVQEALSMAWQKNGQLMFEMDILRQQIATLDRDNKAMKEQLQSKDE